MNKKLNMNMLIIFALSLSGLALVLLRVSKYGPGVTHDSVAYIHAAATFKAFGTFQYFGYPSPFVQWPLLYPLILSLVGKGAAWVNALAFACIIGGVGLVLYKNVKKPAIAIMGALFTLAAYPLFNASGYIWTEPLYILAVLIFMNGLSDGKIHIAAVAAGIACLLRYAGVTLILTGFFYLITTGRNRHRNILYAFAFSVSASLPFIASVLRNYFLTGTLLGMRTPAKATLLHNIRLGLETIKGWYLPTLRPLSFVGDITADFLMLSCLLASIAGAAFIIALLARKKMPMVPLMKISLISMSIYVVYIVASATSVAFDPIGDRYMLPVFLPLLFIVFLLLDQGVNTFKYGAILIGLTFLFWFPYPLAAEYQLTKESIKTGAGGYSTDAWMNAPIMDYLRGMPNDILAYSNRADAIQYCTGRECHYTPKTSGIPLYGYQSFKEELDRKKITLLVWFPDKTHTNIYGPLQLENLVRIKPLQKVGETEVYLILTTDSK